MITNPNGSTTLSKRFNTLQWLPGDTILGIEGQVDQPTGETTEFPINLPARQSSELYWLPKNIAITKARIKTEAFDYSLTVPIFPTGPRSIGHTAEMAHQLIFGVGEQVTQDDLVRFSGLDYHVKVFFKLSPLSILSRIESGSAVWWKIEAYISALPTSTAPKAYGNSILPDTGNGVVNVGTLKFNWINNTVTGERAGIGLYRYPPSIYSDFQQCFCEIELDYVPWEFDN